MRRLLLASAFLVAGFPALAADLPPYSQAPYYEPAPIFTWTGAYVGASAAFGFGNFTHDGAPFSVMRTAAFSAFRRATIINPVRWSRVLKAISISAA